ncbi:DUF4194 domain-containing protein [Aestuariirhabdus sp. Z084]|uniref:DUF4194 domain-containing protein n=1 Tax=Aestuariirhabdus haliotis TaxID=2918751 RepID=UPI00201B432D|nr:DUF4194 domain-containing protein [Aestuariirhabdus haliotis]MCL6415691.1 DUF4194 domain-containing protein [Aestuariirhabdus haliotis]MCL6419783.1 DUF4194 domain-containing protein [Aestuariirhabdus haliotis]
MITDLLQEQLGKQQLELSAFQQVVQRLLDYGVICRDESQTEQELYDRYLRIKSLVDDYLRVIGVRVQHDDLFHYLRLYPPGAQVPGMDDEDQGFSGFRTRPGQGEVALLLVLRSQYEQQLREGQIDDRGCAMVSLESVSIAMKSLLNRTLPLQSTDRRALFRALKRMRVIQFGQEEMLDSGEAWLRIRPMITSLVSHEVLQGLLEPEAPSLESECESEPDQDEQNPSPNPDQIKDSRSEGSSDAALHTAEPLSDNNDKDELKQSEKGIPSSLFGGES